MNLNRVQLAGILGTSIDLRTTQGGHTVASFSLATHERQKTEWHKIVAWDKLGDFCHKYLAKGRHIFIEGQLQTRDWQTSAGDKRSSTEIIAHNVQFLDKKKAAPTAQDSNEADSTLSDEERSSILRDIAESIPP